MMILLVIVSLLLNYEFNSVRLTVQNNFARTTNQNI